MTSWQGVLFDLDGTLVDTAPDLVGAVQDLATERGQNIPAFSMMRQMASHGAPGLLGTAFGIRTDEPGYAELRLAFLDHYRRRAHQQSKLFPGILTVLQELQKRAIPWGIVTNKTEELAQDLLNTLALPFAPAIVVGGDTTAAPKPSPLPVQYALRALDTRPQQTVLLGDDRRDVEAAHAAGCPAWAAAWGYCPESDPPDSWAADAIVSDSRKLGSRLLLP